MALITFYSNNSTATKFFKFVDNLFGIKMLLTESKYCFSVLRYVSSNDMVYFSPHALFSQARSQLWFYKLVWFSVTSFAGLFMWIVMHSAWIVMLTLMLEGVHVLQ